MTSSPAQPESVFTYGGPGAASSAPGAVDEIGHDVAALGATTGARRDRRRRARHRGAGAGGGGTAARRARGGRARLGARRADRRESRGSDRAGPRRRSLRRRRRRGWRLVDRHGQGGRPHPQQRRRPHGLRQRARRGGPAAAVGRSSRSSPCRRRPAPEPRARRSASSTCSPSRSRPGISHVRLRPALAVVDPGLTATQPAGVTASAGMDILCHALESWTARPYTSYERKSPEQRVPYCGSNPISDMWSERSMSLLATAFRTAVRDGSDEAARGEMALAATFAGLGFGNAGVHVPHANAYPVAGRVRDFRPDGYPQRRADGAARHGRCADRARGVPVDLRRRPRAAPRGRPAARPRRSAPRWESEPRDVLPGVLLDLMRDIGMPNGLRRRRLRRGATSTASSRARSSSSGSSRRAPSPSRRDDLARHLHALDAPLGRERRTTRRGKRSTRGREGGIQCRL